MALKSALGVCSCCAGVCVGGWLLFPMGSAVLSG